MEFPTPETAAANPDAPYGTDKLGAENFLAYYGRVWGIETVALRFGNVYGPRQDPHGEAGVIAIFGRRLFRGEPLTVYGRGDQTRDYVYVGDVAEAFFAAATSPIPPAGPLPTRAFNVGTGLETSVLELARLMEELLGSTAEIRFEPARAGEITRSLLDTRKAEKVLGWSSRVALREGLERTLKWIGGDG